MFVLVGDEERRLWVAIVGDPRVVEADYRGVIRLLTRLAELSPTAGEPSVFLLDIVPGSARPPPAWRQRFADAERLGHGKRVAFAVVTDSAVLRGIRTAVNWLAPPPLGYETTALSTIEETIDWAERLRSGIRWNLRALHKEASIRAHGIGRTARLG